MLILKKNTYSIFDVYILMQDRVNYFNCIHPYKFKNLSIFNSIIYGALIIENRKIPFEIDSTNIINSIRDSSFIIDKYIFTIL